MPPGWGRVLCPRGAAGRFHSGPGVGHGWASQGRRSGRERGQPQTQRVGRWTPEEAPRRAPDRAEGWISSSVLICEYAWLMRLRSWKVGAGGSRGAGRQPTAAASPAGAHVQRPAWTQTAAGPPSPHGSSHVWEQSRPEPGGAAMAQVTQPPSETCVAPVEAVPALCPGEPPPPAA